MEATRRTLRLRQLDQSLGSLYRLNLPSPPTRGWIRTIREALGIDLGSMARRLGLTASSAVLKLEQNEVDGAITMRRLRDAANALGCDLVVTFVPREPLKDFAARQARNRAQERLARIDHTMNLEAQEVGSPEMEEMLNQLADELLHKGGTALWG